MDFNIRCLNLFASHHTGYAYWSIVSYISHITSRFTISYSCTSQTNHGLEMPCLDSLRKITAIFFVGDIYLVQVRLSLELRFTDIDTAKVRSGAVISQILQPYIIRVRVTSSTVK